MAVKLLLGDWNEVSPGCIIVSLFYLSIQSAVFLLAIRKRFRSQCHSMVNVIKDYANLYVLSFESAVPFAALDRV